MNNRAEYLLSVKDLCTYFYTYDGILKALDGVSFNIRKGETLGLVGESGCGKSVTALSILRLIQDPPGKVVKGEIWFEDQNLLKLTPKEMRNIRGNKISMIFQEPMTALNPVFPIGEQILEAIRVHQQVSRRAALERVQQILQKVAISDATMRIKDYPHEMSGGMRQRVMIAAALVCNPKLLIADEPTTALDVTIQAQILKIMNDLKNELGASLLLITHDLGIIAEMAQSVAVMYLGRIVEYATVSELFSNPRHPYTSALMKCIPRIDSTSKLQSKLLPVIPGIVPNPINMIPGCSFRERCAMPRSQCEKDMPSLIDLGNGHLVRCWALESA